MILGLFRKKPATEAVHAVYRAIVAQSRQPHFYSELGVPDTVTGRFDMISLHMALLLRRLRSDQAEVQAFGQALFDLFFKDMDRSLREMGAGDLAVPKKIQKMGSIFYGLLAKLNEALDRNDPIEVEMVLSRNLFGGGSTQSTAQLSRYVFAETARLDAQPVASIIAGHIVLDPTE